MSGKAPARGPAAISRGELWGIFAMALAARLAVYWLNTRHGAPIFTMGDSASYLETAKALREGVPPTDDKGHPFWLRTPGYPAFLALLFLLGIASPERLEGAVLVTIPLSALVAVLTAVVTARLAGRRAGVAAGLLMAIEPSSVAYGNLIMSETLFTLALLAAVLVWLRWEARGGTGAAIGLGALAGILTIIRPVTLYLPLAIAPIMIWARKPRVRSLLAAALVAGVSLVPAALWTFRNYRQLGVASLDRRAPRGMALFARGVETQAGVTRTPLPARPQPWEPGFGGGYDWRTVPEAIAIQERYFRDVIRAHPRAAVERWTLNALYLLGVPDSKLPAMVLPRVPAFTKGSAAARIRWLADLGWLGAWLALGMVVSVGGLLSIPLLAARARRWDRGRRALLALLAALALYQVAFSGFVWHQAERYRVPVIPLCAMMLCAALWAGRPAPSSREMA